MRTPTTSTTGARSRRTNNTRIVLLPLWAATTTLLLLLQLVLLILIQTAAPVSGVEVTDELLASLIKKRLKLSELNNLTSTEMVNELDEETYGAKTAGEMWTRATELEWERSLGEMEDGMYPIPFVLCHKGETKRQTTSGEVEEVSGYIKLREMHDILVSIDPTIDDFLNADDGNHTRVLYNDNTWTCATVRIPTLVAAEAAVLDYDWLVVQPMVSMGKLTNGSVDKLEAILTEDETDEVGGGGGDKKKRHKSPPKVHVFLCPGAVSDEDIDDITVDVAENEGQAIKDTILRRTADGKAYIKELFFGGLHNATGDLDPDHDGNGNGNGNYPYRRDNHGGENNDGSSTSNKKKKRREYWEEVFQNGADLEGVCDELVQKFNVIFTPSSLVITLELTDDEDDSDSTTTTGGEITAQERQEQMTIRKWCGLAMLAGLTLIDEVCNVDVEPQFKTGNVQSSWLMQSGIRDTFNYYDVGLDGTGQVVAVSDTGIDVNNCYFWDEKNGNNFALNGRTDTSQRKVVQYVDFVDDSDYEYGHGTHVAGTIAGHRAVDGNTESDGMANGVAKGAKLAFMDIGFANGALSVPVPVDRLLDTGRDADAQIHSASWGAEDNTYGFNARSFDQYMFDNEEFLINVAAGNSGRGNAFNTVGDPATAKNIIAVGAGQSDSPDITSGMRGPNYVADFSSKGPTRDQRTSPMIIAPGHFILSAGARPDLTGECDPGRYPNPGDSSEGVLSISGTSMATPGVSGVAAIIRQYFVEGYYPDGVKNDTRAFRPTSAAVKAIILNGGQPMVGVDNGGGFTGGVFDSQPYDDIQNFGRLSLVDSLYLPGKTNVDVSLFDRESISNGETRMFNVTIDKSRGCEKTELSVTLVWTDPPGSVGCLRCLVNDLDMYVEKVGDTQRYFPNGRSGPDTINNAERVRMSAGDGEVFNIFVKGTNLITSSQQFSMVATGCFGGVANTLDMSGSAFAQSNRTRNIIIGVVCGVVGVLVIGGVAAFLKKRQGGGGGGNDYPGYQ